jgi:hypothetical protein
MILDLILKVKKISRSASGAVCCSRQRSRNREPATVPEFNARSQSRCIKTITGRDFQVRHEKMPSVVPVPAPMAG